MTNDQLEKQSHNQLQHTVPVNILMVDDRPENLLALEAVLGPLGENLVRAYSGAEALRWLLTNDCAVILLDVQMPVLDGFETAALIKEREKSRYIPIIFVTAVSREERFILQGYATGAVDYVAKPFNTDILKAKIAVFVDLFRKSEDIERRSESLRLAERREKERALAVSEAQLSEFRSTLDTTLDGIFMFDADSMLFSYVNDGGMRQLGYDREEILTLTPFDILSAQDAAILQDKLAVLREGTSAFLTLETRQRRKDDGEVPVELFLQYIAPQGGIGRFVAVARDITERKRVEDALTRREMQFRAVIENLAEGLIISDLQGNLIHWNHTALELHGFANVEDWRRHLSEFVHIFELASLDGTVIPAGEWPFARILRGERVRDYEVCVRRLDTDWQRIFSYGGNLMPDASGKVELAFVTISDITAHKKAEEQRAQNQQRLAFLAEAGAVLASTLDFTTTLSSVVRLAVPQIADWCAVDLIEADGTLNRLAVAHIDPAKVEKAAELQRRYPTDLNSERGVPYVIRTGASEIYPELPDAVLVEAAHDAEHLILLRELGFKSAMVVPLTVRGRTMGALTFVSEQAGRTFDSEDLALVEDLARRAAMAVDNARLYQEAQQLNTQLEQRVAERTAQLEAANREVEEAARANRNLMEYSQDIICSIDGKGRFTSVSPACLKIWGYSPDELKDRYFIDFIHPADVAKTNEAAAAIMSGQTTTAFENRYLHRDGTVVSMVWSALWSDEEQSMFCVAHDITARKQAEDRLQQSQALLTAAQALAHLGSWEWDVMADTVIWSDELYRIFGLAPQEFEATYAAYINCVHPEDREMVNETVAKALREKDAFSYDHRIIRPDGAVRVLHARGEVIVDDSGQPGKMVGSAQDVTEVRQATAEAQAARVEAESANAAKSEFLSRMSHELRTPLNAILGFAQLLEMDALTPPQQEGLGHILKGGRHLLELINEVLDLARVEAGQLTVSPEPVPVRQLVQEAFSLLRSLSDGANIQLQDSSFAEPDRHVLADRQRLLQVVLNLVANAIKYNRPGGKVSISGSEVEGERFRIAVTDTGPGITSHDITKLFTPFERLNAAHGVIEGTGLGLALSLRLVKAMGGCLGVESTPGQGSTFWVELPVAASPLQQLEESGFTGGRLVDGIGEEARSVLYIEDNLSNLRLIERLLERSPSITLLSAMQGSMGLDLAREHRPDLILLDLHLPDINGDEVLRQLKENLVTRGIPVVMLSADATTRQIERLRSAGAVEYLTKPLDVKRFLAVLDENLKTKVS